MKITHTPCIVPLLLIIFGTVTAASAQTDKRIDAIRTLYQKINEDIAKSDAEPEYSNIYLTELAVNKNNGSYPAVGIYRPVARFFYTYGDREKEPYPNRLLKIVVAIDRSDRKEYSEYLFNETEQLIFYFEKKDDVERRVYFTGERLIRFQEGERILSRRAKPQIQMVASVLKEKAKLITIFRNSLQF
jgi:hypothetical protein